ncbi:MAG: hypothetical protein CSB13_00610 [Chloroflexi bacterium]|nr:MAG: hypothetical protein CSB13_00610 [Chloroflexota bacterium]
MTTRLFILLTAVLAALLLIVSLVAMPKQIQAAVWQDKVDPWVLETIDTNADTEFLLYLTEQADLSGAALLPTKEEKGQYVVDQLTAVAQRTQPPLIQELSQAGIEYQPFWIANMIWVKGDKLVLAQLARRPDVAHVYANPHVLLPEMNDSLYPPKEVSAIEWGVEKIGAPTAWAAGFTGEGIVIGGQDTGYQWEHPAIKEQYRGWRGSVADHNYSWHDAIHDADNGRCDKDSPEPCDDNSHGTHTMGTMVGDDGGTNQIGVAPGAQWIGCRNMNAGDGTPATYAECYQWFIAPTDLNNENPDPSLAPHVINNSWSCPASEGCTDPNILLYVVDAVRAAGIVTVHSAGNTGSACESIRTPAAIYDASFTVGSTTSTDSISFFSSRGPVTVDDSGRLKPDVSAPGTSVRSSIPTFNETSPYGYSIKSGTSMAGPHVVGQVALLLSARPDLIGNVDEIERIIRETAVPLTSSQTCGNLPGTQVPNHTFGYGRIDAGAIFNWHDPSLQAEVQPVVNAGELLTYTFALTNENYTASLSQVVLTTVIPTDTQWVTATMPYTRDGGTIRWSWLALPPGQNQTVALTVQVDSDIDSSPLRNQYTLISQETEIITGSLQTAVIFQEDYFTYIPLVAREP